MLLRSSHGARPFALNEQFVNDASTSSPITTAPPKSCKMQSKRRIVGILMSQAEQKKNVESADVTDTATGQKKANIKAPLPRDYRVAHNNILRQMLVTTPLIQRVNLVEVIRGVGGLLELLHLEEAVLSVPSGEHRQLPDDSVWRQGQLRVCDDEVR